MDQKLRKIAERMESSCTNLGLLQGKMGSVVFFYEYARHVDCRYEEYADQLIDEIFESIRQVNSNYADGLAGIGVGVEYLAQKGFIDGDINEVLVDVDKLLGSIGSRFFGQIGIRNGITGYGKYYLARINNPDNCNNVSPGVNFFKEQLSNIVDLLSANYVTYENLYSIISFLPDVINLDINKQ